MYKHMADSVKETNDKMFVSLDEKEAFNNKAEITHNHDDLYYTKSQVDAKINTAYVSCKDGSLITTQSKDGFVTELTIEGNSAHEVNNYSILMNRGTYASIDDNGVYTEGGNTTMVSDPIAVSYREKLSFFSVGVLTFDNITVFMYNGTDQFISKRDLGNGNGKTMSIPYDVAKIRVQTLSGSAKEFIMRSTGRIGKVMGVGTKVEGREAYTFDIVSTGKNILKPCTLGNEAYDEPFYASKDRYVTEFYKVKGGKSYVFSSKNNLPQLRAITRDVNGNFISRTVFNRSDQDKIITMPYDAYELQIYMNSGDLSKELYDRENEMKDNCWTLVEHTGSINIEPIEYKESVTTIELPFQLHGRQLAANNSTDIRRDIMYIKNGNLYVRKAVTSVELTRNILTEHGIVTGNGGSSRRIILEKTSLPGCYFNKISEDMWNYGSFVMIDNLSDAKENPTNVHMEFYENPVNFVIMHNVNLSFNQVCDALRGSKIYYSRRYDYEKIDLGPIDMYGIRTFAEGTNIFVRNSAVSPYINCKVPVSVNSSIVSNNNILTNIKNELNDIQKLENSSTRELSIKTGVCVIEGTSEGNYITDLSIKGKTSVNLLNNKNLKKMEDRGYTYNEENNELLCPVTGVDDLMWGNIPPIATLKRGQKYTFMCHSALGKENIQMVGDDNNKDHCRFNTRGGLNIVSFTAYSPSFKLKFFDTDRQTQRSITRVMLVEGEYNASDLSYFYGMSSGSNKIQIVTKENAIPHTFNVPDYSTIRRDYYLDNKLTEGTVIRNISDIGITLLSHHVSTGGWIADNYLSPGKTYTVKAGEFVRTISVYTKSDIFSYIDLNGLIAINEQKYNVKNIELSEPLRSTPNGTRDSIELLDGQLVCIRRCGEFTLTHNDNWKIVIDEYQPSDKTLISFENQSTGGGMVKYTFDDITMYSDYLKIISPETSMTEDHVLKYHSTDKSLRLAIKRSHLKTEDVTGLKQWMQENNITFKVVYELSREIVEPLNIVLSMLTYNDTTVLAVKSGDVHPIIEGKITTRIADVLRAVNEKIRIIEKHEEIINRVKLRSMYESYKTRFKINIHSGNYRTYNNVDKDLFTLLCLNIMLGVNNYNRYEIEEQLDFYVILGLLDFEMTDYLFNLMDSQQIEELI